MRVNAFARAGERCAEADGTTTLASSEMTLASSETSETIKSAPFTHALQESLARVGADPERLFELLEYLLI